MNPLSSQPARIADWRRPVGSVLFLLISAWLSLAGWVLSLFHALNAIGYAVGLLAGVPVIWLLLRPVGLFPGGACNLDKCRWRLRHWLPFLFFFYAMLALLGGLLYPPTNYDALTYRVPRVLHWLAESSWHWITTNTLRMNFSGATGDWLTAPLLALTHSDRLLFLWTAIGFVLLPGLLFGVLTQLGVRSRVAWHWMWVLPAGYCFVLQAGGLGNDILSAVYCLAALYFTLRARKSLQVEDLWLGTLGAALLTGVKASNLPLLLPWALAALPSVGLLRRRWVGTVGVAFICVGSSLVPIAWANTRFAGNWGGDPHDQEHVKIGNPVYGVIGNALQIVAANALPPVAPFAKRWNEAARQWMETPFARQITKNFTWFDVSWNELPQEEAAALGLGVTGLVLVTAVAAMRRRANPSPVLGDSEGRTTGWLICGGAWVALFAYMAMLGSLAGPRLLSPYYPLLVCPALLLPGNAELIRRRWWRGLALAAALCALPPLILSPARPLWPARTVCKRMVSKHPHRHFWQRANTVYSVYAGRADGLAPLRRYIPPGTKAIGFLAVAEAETSLWRPFGSRRVYDVTPENLTDLIKRNVSPIFVTDEGVEYEFGRKLEDWLARYHLRVLAKETLVTQAARPPQEFYAIVAETDVK